METKFQTSFIPKKTVTETKSSGSGMGIFLFVSIVIFLVSLGIAGWVYLQKQMLVSKIVEQQGIIATNEDSFDTNTIESILTLNKRITLADGLLQKHVSVSPIFNFLQQATLKNVRFRDFNFSSLSKDENGTPRVAVKLSGIAKDFETVASQADELGSSKWSKIISEPKISNFSLNTDGSVSFLFTAYVSPSFILYESDNSITE